MSGNQIDINSNFYGPKKECKFDFQFCKKLKKSFLNLGYATQADADYFAMRILEKYPVICKSLARRFPELIIDEAQDTSDIQMRIIDCLIESGVSNVMLVGDPDQAIYEWREAKPEIFISKTKHAEWESELKLTQNRRSSQLICDLTRNFSAHLRTTSNAVGDAANYDLSPKLVTYKSNEILSIKTAFINFCRSKGFEISPEKVAILVRARRQLRILKGISVEVDDPWNHTITKLLIHAACYRDKGEFKNARSYLEAGISRTLFGNRFHSKAQLEEKIENHMGMKVWSKFIWNLLMDLPSTRTPLKIWLTETKKISEDGIKTYGFKVTELDNLKIGVKCYVLVNKKRYTDFYNQPVSCLLANSTDVEDLTIETIHAAKGKTYDAVLYLVNDNRGKKGTIKQIIEKPIDNEEVRTAYVAMTRPRKILLIAIPEGTPDELLMKRFPEAMVKSKGYL